MASQMDLFATPTTPTPTAVDGVHVSAIFSPEGMAAQGMVPGRALLQGWFERDDMWARVQATWGDVQADMWAEEHSLEAGQPGDAMRRKWAAYATSPEDQAWADRIMREYKDEVRSIRIKAIADGVRRRFTKESVETETDKSKGGEQPCHMTPQSSTSAVSRA